MEGKPREVGRHMFSIQLKSKDDLKNVSLPNDEEGTILLEGFLGMLEDVDFTEGIMFEIKGSNGSLRMDLTQKELKKLLLKKRPSGHIKQI